MSLSCPCGFHRVGSSSEGPWRRVRRNLGGQTVHQGIPLGPQHRKRPGGGNRFGVPFVAGQQLGAIPVQGSHQAINGTVVVVAGAVAFQGGIVLAVVVDHQVHVVAVPASGQTRVCGLAVEPVVA